MPIITVSSASGENPNQELAYVQITTNATTTQTTQASATTILTAPAITLDGATRILVEAYSPSCGHSVANGVVVLDLWQDSTDLAIISQMRPSTGSSGSTAMFGRMFLTPGAGSPVFTIRMWIVTAGTGTFGAGAGTGGVAAPAYLRITKAPLGA